MEIGLPDKGALFVVAGPSGVGKSTLIGRLMESLGHPENGPVGFSVSATTRAPRAGEVNGRYYNFVTDEAFAELLSAGALVEHATVYGHSYGTPRAVIDEALAAGRSLILDIDVQGARQVRRSFPEAVHIFILPPDLATLRARLVSRRSDAPSVIEARMAQAGAQLRGCLEFDFLIVNDHLDTASATLLGVVLSELSRVERRSTTARAILRALDQLP